MVLEKIISMIHLLLGVKFINPEKSRAMPVTQDQECPFPSSGNEKDFKECKVPGSYPCFSILL